VNASSFSEVAELFQFVSLRAYSIRGCGLVLQYVSFPIFDFVWWI